MDDLITKKYWEQWRKDRQPADCGTPEHQKRVHDALCQKFGSAILQENGKATVAQTYFDAIKK